MANIRELMPEWTTLLEEMDESKICTLAMSGKDFEIRIPTLASEMRAGILTGIISAPNDLAAFLCAFAQATYWMGYQRGKKEKRLTFVVREDEA